MKRVILIVVSLILSSSVSLCADLNFKSDNEFGEWTTFYYQHPDPQRVPMALEYYCNSPMYKTNATIPMAAFFSALSKKDTGLMQNTFDNISLSGSENAKIMLINILSLTNNSESKVLLEKAQSMWQSERLQGILANRIAYPYEDLYAKSVDSALVLDMLWGSFFATGEAIPIQRIISVLHLKQEGHGNDILVGGAANWSLHSNAQQHPMVLEICKNELSDTQGITKEMLEAIIQASNK